METINPATPATAATPGNNGQVNNPLIATPPAQGTGGDTGGEKIAISADELRQLKRDQARLGSVQKKLDILLKNNNASSVNLGENADPDLVEIIRQKDTAIEGLGNELYKERLSNRARTLLEGEKFKNLPKSTRELIIKNPSVLTKSSDVDEAIMDIEDYVSQEVAAMSIPVTTKQTDHETPPVINAGTPYTPNANGLEDVNKLPLAERAQGVLRNALRKAKGVQ